MRSKTQQVDDKEMNIKNEKIRLWKFVKLYSFLLNDYDVVCLKKHFHGIKA